MKSLGGQFLGWSLECHDGCSESQSDQSCERPSEAVTCEPARVSTSGPGLENGLACQPDISVRIHVRDVVVKILCNGTMSKAALQT